MFKRIEKRYIPGLLIVMFFTTILSGQTTQPVKQDFKGKDSLTMAFLLHTVIENHPTVKQAEEVLNATNAHIANAQSGYYPTIIADGNYTYINPTPSINFFGSSFVMAPKNNVDASLNLRQTIFDFGKTSNAVDVEKENQTQAKENIDLAKQSLALATIQTFYNLVYLQNAIDIKDTELKTLNEHLDYILKREVTGSATQYECLVTKVRISNNESQKTELLTMQRTAWEIMDMLTGLKSKSGRRVTMDTMKTFVAIPSDSLFNYAFGRRVDLEISKENETIALMRYNLTKKTNMPVLSAIASTGWKNGYFPNIYPAVFNYEVGLDLNITLFDGFKKKSSVDLAKSDINNATLATELVRRNISQEVVENDANRLAAETKIQQFTLQLKQSEDAFALARTSYSSGAITNLDLLEAETEVSDARLLLMKAKIDYEVSIYKLKIALGDKPYEN